MTSTSSLSAMLFLLVSGRVAILDTNLGRNLIRNKHRTQGVLSILGTPGNVAGPHRPSLEGTGEAGSFVSTPRPTSQDKCCSRIDFVQSYYSLYLCMHIYRYTHTYIYIYIYISF